MALFKPYKCLEAQLGQIPITEGQVIFTTDTLKIYMDDADGSRKEYTPDIPDSTKVFIQNAEPETAKDGDLWFVLDK